MPEQAKSAVGVEKAELSRHATRLEALSREAAEIRQQHRDGVLSSEDAAQRLDQLKRRHAGFLERIIG